MRETETALTQVLVPGGCRTHLETPLAALVNPNSARISRRIGHFLRGPCTVVIVARSVQRTSPSACQMGVPHAPPQTKSLNTSPTLFCPFTRPYRPASILQSPSYLREIPRLWLSTQSRWSLNCLRHQRRHSCARFKGTFRGQITSSDPDLPSCPKIAPI